MTTQTNILLALDTLTTTLRAANGASIMIGQFGVLYDPTGKDAEAFKSTNELATVLADAQVDPDFNRN